MLPCSTVSVCSTILKAPGFAWEASRMELQQQKDQLMLSVILAYLDILTNEDLLEQAKKQLEVSRKQVERLEIMNKEGAIKPSDFYDLKGQYADNKISLINTTNDLNRSKLALAQLMNQPYRADLTKWRNSQQNSLPRIMPVQQMVFTR